MKQKLRPARRAAGLLIAAAALPLTPSFAQDVQSPTAPPPTPQSATPPPAAQAPVDLPPTPAPTVTPAPAPVPPVAVPPPAIAATPGVPTSTSTPARATARAPVRTRSSFATAARATRAAPTAAATRATSTPAPAAAPAPAPAPVAAAPAPAPAIAPAPAPVPSLPATTTTSDRPARSWLPWLVIALLVLGVAAFALLRRRRRVDVYETDEMPAAEPVAAAAPVAAATATGRPWLDLALQPVRAGVEGDEAVVEFALKVDNHGVAPARDVRVSAFMLQAGASEAERNLIEPKEMPPVEIAAGESKRVETAVALPTDKVEGDSVLPVVVADARYTLPDGSEGRTSATFAVGVPDGEELAHFAVDNPSGLHDGVVARPLGEMEKA